MAQTKSNGKSLELEATPKQVDDQLAHRGRHESVQDAVEAVAAAYFSACRRIARVLNRRRQQ